MRGLGDIATYLVGDLYEMGVGDVSSSRHISQRMDV